MGPFKHRQHYTCCKSCNKKTPFARGMNHSVEEGRLSSNGCLEHRFCEAILGRLCPLQRGRAVDLGLWLCRKHGNFETFCRRLPWINVQHLLTISVCPCPTQEPKSWIWGFGVVRWAWKSAEKTCRYKLSEFPNKGPQINSGFLTQAFKKRKSLWFPYAVFPFFLSFVEVSQ